MKKIYHLPTCSTCQEIIKKAGISKENWTMQDIKTEKITGAQLDELKGMAGSYDLLFSRRAMKYKELGLKDRQLSEEDIRKLILEEYTFLKRPVVMLGDRLFIGSEKKTIAALLEALL